MLKSYPLSFEDALSELEALVDTLEQDDLPLDESLMRFGNGLVTASATQGVQAEVMRLEPVENRYFAMNINKLFNRNE